ncbi:MAG: hypothetical protein H7222_14220 [Methylotenera sp.]|nr:hypothetical protein [Oligoflexia bacterium]
MKSNRKGTVVGGKISRVATLLVSLFLCAACATSESTSENSVDRRTASSCEASQDVGTIPSQGCHGTREHDEQSGFVGSVTQRN